MYYYLPFITTYTILSILTFTFDLLSTKFDSLKKLKADPITYNEYIDIYKKIYPQVIINVIISTLPISCFIEYIYTDYHGLDFVTIILDLYLIEFLSSMSFYWLHRVFHRANLYKYHKTHHELKISVGMGAAYASIYDYLIVNLFPIGIVPVLMGVNPVVIKYWLVYYAFVTVVSHSNLKCVSQHDYHHKYFKCNYGTYWIDKLYGTLYN